MAYNKSKFVEAAQKLLNQGKVPQAISEYQQILKYEPRDQVTLMTVGELYIRQGETFQAIDYFERLAQIFVGDGFLTKAIAVYKRIAKLAPEEIRPLEKLADLYVQQGVMSEARPLFLQLAEIHLKNNRQPEAVGLLKKLLLAEPDNLRIQIRLADLYQAMGQPREAIETYVSAAQRAIARGDHAECEKLADKALKLEPHNFAALIVKARSASAQGNAALAIELLEQVPGLEKGGEQTELLLDLYLKNAKWDPATALALRVFEADEKNFGPTQKLIEALLESGQGEKAMAILEKSRIPMIDAGEHELVGRLLNELAARLPGRIEPLEWLVDSYGRTSDSFRLPDALAQLGDALVAAKQFDRAKQTFEQLVDRQPESDSAKRKLDDLLRTMGLAPEAPPAPPEEHHELELAKPPAPKIRPDLPPDVPIEAPQHVTHSEDPIDDDTQKFIAQSLTDVDLFASYGLTQKAIGLLEAILRRAPRHAPTLEKLLDFVLGAGDDRRTAELAAQLEQLHQQNGDDRAAERFGELRRRFQRAAGLTDAELAAFSAPAPAFADATPHAGENLGLPSLPEMEVPELPVPHAESHELAAAPSAMAAPSPSHEVSASQAPAGHALREVDLSDEWASLLDGSAESAPASSHPAQPPESLPHAEFEISADAPGLEEFSIVEETSDASQPVPPAPAASHEFTLPEAAAASDAAAEFADISAHLPASEDVAPPPQEISQHSQTPAIEEPVLAKPPAVPEQHVPAVPEPEFELDQDYELILDPEPLVPAYDQKPPETPLAVPAVHAAPEGSDADKFLADLASEMGELGLGELTPSFSASSPAAHSGDANGAPRAAEPRSSRENAPLQEVFDEFRAELGEMGTESEDLETHYNLGVAFREMGLLDEAISEFQKVAQACDQGRPFPYTMQCCTLLGLAFIEKGQPSMAAIWYQRALLTPGLGSESALALRYDLGVAQESAGEHDAALKSFSHVYAMNIDYRDVAERIAALQKPSR
jgi:pilus assembly protein FimV